MLRASQFEVAAIQATLFTPDVATFSPTKFLANLPQNVGSFYAGPVTSLPLPSDAPPQLPRVLLQSADSIWRLQVAPARVDASWSPPSRLAAPVVLEEIVARCSGTLQEYARAERIRVGRLALILQRAHLVDNPAQELVRHFCKDDLQQTLFAGSENFELHNHKRYQLQPTGYTVNSWVRCRTVQFAGEAAVAVEQDINTLEEDLAWGTFTTDDIERFLPAALVEAAAILRRFFPEDR